MVFVIFWFYVVYNDNFILWTPRSGVGTPFLHEMCGGLRGRNDLDWRLYIRRFLGLRSLLHAVYCFHLRPLLRL